MKCCSMYTYNENILFHSGESVLYSVPVRSRSLTNSKTQNGSLFPFISAATKFSAL